MKKAFLKDILRMISKQKVSYISIVVIALLAVTAYLGINFGSAALKKNAARFYLEQNFRDFEVTSTQLLTQADLHELKRTDGVADVEGVLQVNGAVIQNEKLVDVTVLSVTERINQPIVVEGRLPETKNECAIEQELLETLELKVGDSVPLTNERGKQIDYLNGTEFTITGSVIHPDHYAKGIYVPGARYALVTKEAFDQEKLDGAMMKAVLVMEKAPDLKVFDKGYTELSKTVKNELDPLSELRADLRSKEVRKQAEDKINEGQTELDDAKKKLDDGRKLLDDKSKELRDGEQKLIEGKAQLDAGKAQLDYAAGEIASGEQKLIDSKAQLDQAAGLLALAETELPAGKEKLDAAKAEIDKGRAELDAAKEKIVSAEKLLKDGFVEAENMKSQMRDLMKDAVIFFAGEEKAAEIPWAQPNLNPNVADPALSIGVFEITESSSVYIGGSLADLAYSILELLPDAEEYETDIEEVINWIKNHERYPELNELYETQVSSKMQQWEDGHKTYIDGLVQYQTGEETFAAGYKEYQNGVALYEQKLAEYEQGKAQYESGLALYNTGLQTWQNAKAQYETGIAEYNRRLADYQNGLNLIETGKQEIEKGEKEYREGLLKYQDGVKKLDDAKAELEGLAPCRWVVLDVTGNGSFMNARDSAENAGKLGMTFAFLFIVVGALVIYVTTGRIMEESRQLIGTQKALGFYNREILLKYLIFGGSATLIGILLGTLLGYFGIQFLLLYVHQIFYQIVPIPNTFLPLMFVTVLVAGLILACGSVTFACLRLIRKPARELMQEKMPVTKKKKYGKSKTGGSLYSRLIFRNMAADKGRIIVTTISIAGCCTLLMIGFTLQRGIQYPIDKQFSDLYTYDAKVTFSPDAQDHIWEEVEDVLEKEHAVYTAVSDNMLAATVNGKFDGFEIISANQDDLPMIFNLNDVKTGARIKLPESGVVIMQRTAETAPAKVGDTITLYDSKMNPHETTVKAVCHMYFGRGIFMSDTAYKEIFGEEPVTNTYYYDVDGNAEEIKDRLSSIYGFQNVITRKEQQQSYNNVGRSLTAVTIVLIIAAGMMAYFILLNLINMYLAQKKRELTIMRVNGYTSKEVIGYVSRESIVTTIFGIVLGLILGAIIAYVILRTLEQPHAGFERSLSLPAILLSTGITGLFSFAINAFGLRKIKNLKLTDIND